VSAYVNYCLNFKTGNLVAGANGRTGQEWRKLVPYLRSRLGKDCNVSESCCWCAVSVCLFVFGVNCANLFALFVVFICKFIMFISFWVDMWIHNIRSLSCYWHNERG